jgi:hypothetical protein
VNSKHNNLAHEYFPFSHTLLLSITYLQEVDSERQLAMMGRLVSLTLPFSLFSHLLLSVTYLQEVNSERQLALVGGLVWQTPEGLLVGASLPAVAGIPEELDDDEICEIEEKKRREQREAEKEAKKTPKDKEREEKEKKKKQREKEKKEVRGGVWDTGWARN